MFAGRANMTTYERLERFRGRCSTCFLGGFYGFCVMGMVGVVFGATHRGQCNPVLACLVVAPFVVFAAGLVGLWATDDAVKRAYQAENAHAQAIYDVTGIWAGTKR
jgi:uncharacterized membrane protein